MPGVDRNETHRYVNINLELNVWIHGHWQSSLCLSIGTLGVYEKALIMLRILYVIIRFILLRE
jgi:hypothetical protein